MENNVELDKPFSEQEVKRTIDLMVKNKAPNPHGIPVEFYQTCWLLIRHGVMALFHDWFVGGFKSIQAEFWYDYHVAKNKRCKLHSEV